MSTDAEEDDPTGTRAALTLLRAVGVLHQRGFEQLRIVPGIAPTGLHWRCTLSPASATDSGLVARYTTGNGSNYFGTGTSGTTTAEELATVIEAHFPDLVEAARRHDPAYVHWFVALLAIAETGFLPYFYAEDLEGTPEEVPLAPITGAAGGDPPRLAMPPPPP